MYNFKKLFTYMVVGALVMALSISCKSNEEPTGSTSQNHPSQGNYYNSTSSSATVKINNDGTCAITGKAYFDDTDYQAFDITVTKWWYLYNYPNTYNAGSSVEKSEATINSPATDSFGVSYEDSRSLSINFKTGGKTYYAINLTK